VTILNRVPSKFSPHARERLGYMPQHFVLYPNLTVWENLNFVASLYGMGYLRRRKPLEQALEFVELSDARNRLGSQLSGGMQRRLELACTLVHNPLLIFADEPTAGIDPVLRQVLGLPAACAAGRTVRNDPVCRRGCLLWLCAVLRDRRILRRTPEGVAARSTVILSRSRCAPRRRGGVCLVSALPFVFGCATATADRAPLRDGDYATARCQNHPSAGRGRHRVEQSQESGFWSTSSPR
jgi:hypothetical protein